MAKVSVWLPDCGILSLISNVMLGYSEDRSLTEQPDVSVVGRIDGAEAAYVVTPLLFVSSALRMLDMETRGTLKRGVLTSAIVFRDVDLLGELSLDSRLKWSVG